MSAAPEQPDLQAVRGRGDDPGATGDDAGRSNHDVLAEDHSGLGKRLNSPSSIMAWAPCAVSSAGWKTTINVPRHASAGLREQRGRADEPGRRACRGRRRASPAPSSPHGLSL